jgi:CDP-diacylglycerol--glycerol-3-phosphate 3-phosphatidyltransferase
LTVGESEAHTPGVVVLTTANKITIARIILVPVFVLLLLEYIASGRDVFRWLAIAIFFLAAAGDGVDGWVARRFNQRTEMGALLDPLADKLLLVLGLIMLSLDNGARLDRVPIWLTITVLARDVMLLVLLVLVNYLVGKGTVRPHMVGKIATVLQMTCVLWALLRLDANALFWWAAGATACTAVSGLIYLGDGIAMLRQPRAETPKVPDHS